MAILGTGAQLGRYRITSVLGKGATGRVYAARDTSLNIDVALKVLVSFTQSNDEAIERFKRELLLARGVSHPGICRVLG